MIDINALPWVTKVTGGTQPKPTTKSEPTAEPTAEEIAEGARELSWRHPEARNGRA